uniref:Uncharacterized protein n=1 Tax=Acrobeloides nanus TaxID=290746 RepID=A0A914D9I5_9BILA
MCRIDGRNFDETGLDRVLAKENQIFMESKSKSRTYSFFHLFYTAKFASYTIALSFALIVTSIMNYSLLFNMERLSGSIYLNAVFLAGIRYVMNMSIASLERHVKCVGRKMIHLGALIFVEVWLIVLIFIYVTDTTEQYILLLRLAPLLIVGIASQFYIVNGVVSNELFP